MILSVSTETKTNSESNKMVRLTRNIDRDENTPLLEKDNLSLNDWSQTSNHFQHGNISANQEIDNKNKNEVKDNLKNQALLLDYVDQLHDNHLIEKRDDSYLEHRFITSQDDASKYGKYSKNKFKSLEKSEPKRFRQMYEDGKLERIKYSETENEPHYVGNRLDYESLEKSRKLSREGKVHKNVLRKRIQNKDSLRNVRSRQSIKGMHKIQKIVKPSKLSLNKFENNVRPINGPLNGQQHFHESSHNLMSSNGDYFRTHKKRSSTEHSEDENAVNYPAAEADNPDLLLNTNINKENSKNKGSGISEFIDYSIGKFDGQEGENSDYEGISEKQLPAEDDISLYLPNFNILPNISKKITNDYKSKAKLSQFSNNKVHLNPELHIHQTNPFLNSNYNNLFRNFSFTLATNELVTEPNKNNNPEENRVEKLQQDVTENKKFNDASNEYTNLSSTDNETKSKDVFIDQTTQMINIDENNTFIDINAFSEMNVSEFTDFTQWSPLPVFSEPTESTTDAQEPEAQLAPTVDESEHDKDDDIDLKLAHEVIVKVLKKVEENEQLRQHILPSLEINPEETENLQDSHKATLKDNDKAVIDKMSHELESLVEHEVREEECLVLSPQQKYSLSRLLEFSKKEESNTENTEEIKLKKLVKSDSKDTDTSFAEAMNKKITTLKHLLSQYEKLSEDEKLKVHNVHEYLIEQLNNVYRLINLEESQGYETYFSHKMNSGINNSPMGVVKHEKISSADFDYPSKQNKNNALHSISDESRIIEHTQPESSITDPLNNLLHTLKKHISKNVFNKEQHKNDESFNKKNKVQSTNGNDDLLVSDNKRSSKSREKRKTEHQNHDLKNGGGISSAYYTLALLAKEN